MQKLVFIIIVFVVAVQAKAQYANQTDASDSTISSTNNYHHRYYHMSGRNIDKELLLTRLGHFQSSANELSRSQIHLGLSLFFLGAFASAYIIPNPTSLLFSIIGIPSCLIESSIARKHFRKSIQLYNQEMSKHHNT